jgi:methionyl-tRNA synthetase
MAMARTVYFTTPIYYVNAEPHIGHLYTTVLADMLKRYHRMMGDDAYFLTGTDEHGEKIAQVADKKGLKVEELTAQVTEIFRDTWKKIGIDNDDFIHTTEPRHKLFVQDVLKKVHDAGDIYFDEYTGLYCVGCERYLTETELQDGLCPDHQTAPKPVKEANYFFKMSKYQERLLDHIEKHPDWIRPERFRNEVLSFLKQPLGDLCISRPKTRLSWGIELPFDNRFVTYVWFDALLNYVSGIKKTSDGLDVFDHYWPHCTHLVAKDILKTHAIYWPCMLFSANLHPTSVLPEHIDVHGYWLSGDSKMSKSLGNVVRPESFDKQFGIENLRYFFFREMKFGQDASFTYETFVERYNADLANGLGNLLSRVSSIVKKNLGGVLPNKPALDIYQKSDLDLANFFGPNQNPPIQRESKIEFQANEISSGYPEAMETRQFHCVVESIRNILASADKYINDMEPWRLAKDEARRADLERVLYIGLEVVRISTILLSPIMPNTCKDILSYLGENRSLDGNIKFGELTAFGGLKSGHVLGEVPRAFPRIDEEKLKSVLKEAEVEAEAAKQSITAPAAAMFTPKPILPEITIDEFAKVNLKVGIVKEAGLVQGADKLVRLMVDVGEEKPRQVFAGIRAAYPDPTLLIGRKLIVVVNLKPRQMKFGLSEGMVLAGGGGTDRLEAATFEGELFAGERVG